MKLEEGCASFWQVHTQKLKRSFFKDFSPLWNLAKIKALWMTLWLSFLSKSKFCIFQFNFQVMCTIICTVRTVLWYVMSIAGTLMILVSLFTNKWLEGHLSTTNFASAGKIKSISSHRFSQIFIYQDLKCNFRGSFGHCHGSHQQCYWWRKSDRRLGKACRTIHQLQGDYHLVHFVRKVSGFFDL